MTVGQVLKSHPNIEIELLLAQTLKKPKEFVYLHPEIKLTKKQSAYLAIMIKRRKKGEPIAYILGYKDFYGLRFKVTQDTLVPRPETELIVDIALGLIKKNRLRSVLDVGTGSGCIAISIAKNSKVKVVGSDVSKKALTVAKHNTKTHHASVKLLLSDLLDSLDQSFDLIIANLPYGWSQWKNNSSADTLGLKFEPKTALFTKEGGLYEIRRLLEQIAARKKQPKFILLEFDPRQRSPLARLIKKTLPKGSVKFYKDLGELWRVAEVALG